MKYYVHGKPCRESTGKRDYYETLNVLKLKVPEVNLHGDMAPSTLTIRQHVQLKLRKNKVEDLHDLYNPEARWKLYLKPFFGNVKVWDFSSVLVMQYIDPRQDEGASGASIDKETQGIRGAFSSGTEVTPPLVRSTPHFPMTGEDYVREVLIETEKDKKKFREAAAKEGPYILGLVEIALTYGWRRGCSLAFRSRTLTFCARCCPARRRRTASPTRCPCWRTSRPPSFPA